MQILEFREGAYIQYVMEKAYGDQVVLFLPKTSFSYIITYTDDLMSEGDVMLDKNSPIPLYYQLKEQIRQQIEDGTIKPGEKLLSESEMIQKYCIGRLTVREALSQLVNEGFLEKQHGRGTFCKGTPSRSARLNIDVLLNTSDNYFIPYYIRGINEVLINHNANFLIHDTMNDVNHVGSLLEKILEKGTSGVILQPSMKEEDIPEYIFELFRRFKSKGIPYFMIDSCYKDIESSYTIMDEVRGGYISTEHLIKLGHKRIGGIFRRKIRDSIYREKGYRQVLEKYDLEMHPEWILEDDEKLTEQLEPLVFGEERVTAFVCYNDEIALKCLRFLKGKGLRVPDDISVMGYDDSFIAETADIPLTTVVHPKDKMAKLAAEKLMEIINKSEDWPFTYMYEPRLVIRSSTRKL